jgi:hypothetical protein
VKAARLVLGALGVTGIVWGAWLLRDDGLDKLLSTALWFGGVVVLHDFVLAPVVVVLGVVAARTFRRRAVVAVAFLIWGTITVAVANVLSGVGGKPDMDSLLNRPYVSAWLALSCAVLAGAVAVSAMMRRRHRADEA